MKTDVLFTIGGKNFHLFKLMGAFIVFAAVLMLFQGVANMFDTWDELKAYPSCLESSDAMHETVLEAQEGYKDCKEILYRKTGIQLLHSQVNPTARQYWMAFLEPIFWIFVWAIMFFFGTMLYNTGKIVIPIQKKIFEPKNKKKKGKK